MRLWTSLHPVEAVIPGAQGRILAVLARTSGEVNLRTIARLSGVSAAQASRVLPDLVALGIIERREAPPSARFRFVPEHVAAASVLALTDARRLVLDEVARTAAEVDPTPVSVVVFGSFAGGEAVSRSDLDVVVVRPHGTGEEDEGWREAVERWTAHLRRFTGNRVDPFLSLHGTDPGPGYADWLTSLVPSATVEVWDGLGHWLHLVDPGRFLDRLDAFLASV